MNIPQGLPKVKADSVKLKQVMLNLVSNAIKFTEEGEVLVSAVREDGFVRLSVEDSGVGIKKADMEHIFDQFRQADGTSTRKFGGTGLGLAISKKIVEMHGGRIWVESRVGEGSAFYFTVPVAS